MTTEFRRLPICLFAMGVLANGPLGAQDDVEGPWGTVHGNIFGTAASADIPYALGEGPIEEKWRIDVVGEGHDRPGGRASIAFDKDGNLYWTSSSGGGTGGVIRLVSASPGGAIRWNGNEGPGTVHQIGTVFSGASPVVGKLYVYAAGDIGGSLALAAYKKDTGEVVWEADLSPSAIGSNQVLTPVLYRGKLYAAGLAAGKTQDFWRIDAEDGSVDWGPVNIPEVGIVAVHQMALVPDAFGAGLHGLYFNGDSGSGTDGIGEVYGIEVSDGGARLAWKSDGGKVARSHVIYSEELNALYTLTWSDYGAQFYVFDPVSGFVGSHANSQNSGHGFYDVGALDFDATVIGGGFDGLILRYVDSGGGAVTDEVIYKGGTQFAMPYWGETRVNGQLVRDADGNSILIAATNSLQCCTSKIFALDVSNAKLLWQYDTGVIWPHQFQYAGGPLVGPDGKVYYFPRFQDGTTRLVALGLASAEPPPSAGFLLANAAGGDLPVAPACVKGGETILADGSCSVGKDLTFTYAADPPDGVEIVQDPPGGPAAAIRCTLSGTYVITLTVENEGGSDECSSAAFCVEPAPPTCALAVTDEDGGPIDDADDDDPIPCLAAGGTAIADASASAGGDLQYEFTVAPSEGTTVFQAGGSEDPRASITIADPGRYTISVVVSNGLGERTCSRQICVATTGGRQKPGDANQDGKFDISDPVGVLNHLFLGTNPVLPCGDGTTSDPANVALLDLNDGGAGRIDLSDAVYGLNFLFLGGPPPLQCAGDTTCPCVLIAGCPDVKSGDCAP